MSEPVLVGVTIHICRDAGEQADNFWYVEQALERRGHGSFKHVLPPGPIPAAEAERAVGEIARIVHRGLRAVILPHVPEEPRKEGEGEAAGGSA